LVQAGCGFLICAAAFGQAPSPGASPAAAPAPTPVPKAEIVAATESDLATLVPPSPTADKSVFLTDNKKRLSEIGTDIQARTPAATALLAAPATSAAFQSEGAAWASLKEQITKLEADLKTESARIGAAKDAHQQIRARWTATKNSPEKLPEEVSDRVIRVLQQTNEEDRRLATQESRLLELQNDAANREASVDKMITALAQARMAAMNRLTIRDSLPLWQRAAYSRAVPGEENKTGFRAQVLAVGTYLRTETGGMVVVLAIGVALLASFRWARSRARDWVEKEPRLARSTRIFEVPTAAALVATIAIAPSLFPNSPHLLAVGCGALLIVPLLIVVRKLVEPVLSPLTWALAVFYVAGRFREAVAPFPPMARLVLLAETLAAAFFALWLVRISRVQRRQSTRNLWRIMVPASQLAFAAFAFATIANVIGFANLSLFVAHAILGSAFVAVLIYTIIRIGTGLVTFALCVPPLSLTAAVRKNRGLLERRSSFILHVAGFAAWLAFTLEELAIFNPLWNGLARLLTEQLKFGPVSAATLLEFALTVWAAFLVSRFVRFILEEEVFHRVRLSAGMPFAISTLLHYTILFVGFYLAAAILVGDMTKFTILAGAFSVGVGFGLQTIVNNFVSGIIVLFERPVKIGDVIQVGTDIGTVRRIGIRATVMRTQGGAELIIPNSKLVSDPVT
ncbi:MAG TPA: mechanosensitive ion channel domain-containing protein, partial [Chthoniobacterales bacterium]|nr:mechanosensitive ion channel domain-containing protein [Chthoniobacterales bacterium]